MSGSGFSCSLTWYLPPSPRPGCSITEPDFLLFFSFPALSKLLFSDLFLLSVFFSALLTGSIPISFASSTRKVSSYPLTKSSIGSPIGAYFTRVTTVPGINPISSMWCLSCPSPATDIIFAFFPISSSFNFIIKLNPHTIQLVYCFLKICKHNS